MRMKPGALASCTLPEYYAQTGSYVKVIELIRERLDPIVNNSLRSSNHEDDVIEHMHSAGRRLSGVLSGRVPVDALLGNDMPSVQDEGVYAGLMLRLDRLGIIRCAHCDKLGLKHGSIEGEYGNRIGSCCAHYYVRSVLMDTYLNRESGMDVIYGIQGDTVLRDHVSSTWAERNCRRHARGSRTYIVNSFFTQYVALFPPPSEPDPTYGTENPFRATDVHIGGYHTSKNLVKQLPSPVYDKLARPLRVGIELELVVNRGVEASDSIRRSAARDIKALLNKHDNYALCEHDGSIGFGFEIVTGWTGLDTHERILSVLRSDEFALLKKRYGLLSHDAPGNKCGLHVTIDRADMSALHLAKMVVFLNHPANKPLVHSVCRRYAEGYCKIKTQLHNYSQRKAEGIHDRYEILNATKDGVLEFRGPRGTLKFESIMASMEFIRMVWMFAEHASASALTTQAFIDFVWRPANSADAKYLREYLVSHKIAPPESRESGGRLTLTEAYREAVEMKFISESVDV